MNATASERAPSVLSTVIEDGLPGTKSDFQSPLDSNCLVAFFFFLLLIVSLRRVPSISMSEPGRNRCP